MNQRNRGEPKPAGGGGEAGGGGSGRVFEAGGGGGVELIGAGFAAPLGDA